MTNFLPKLVYGTYKLKKGQQTYDAVTNALNIGYRAFDTATLYQNEQDVGKAIMESGLSRDQLFIQGKIWDTDCGIAKTTAAVRKSIALLETHLDLCLIHSPRQGKSARIDAWRELVSLQNNGIIRHIGVSNFGIDHIEQLINETGVIPEVIQIDIHPFNSRKTLRDYCTKRNILVQAHSPLTRGRLLNDKNLLNIANLAKTTPAGFLLNWSSINCDSTVVRSEKPKNIAENMRSMLYNVELKLDTRLICGLDCNYQVMGIDLCLVP